MIQAAHFDILTVTGLRQALVITADYEGDPFPLTSYTLHGAIGTYPRQELICSVDANGRATVQWDSVPAGKWKYDVFLVDAEKNETPLMEGVFEALPRITPTLDNEAINAEAGVLLHLPSGNEGIITLDIDGGFVSKEYATEAKEAADKAWKAWENIQQALQGVVTSLGGESGDILLDTGLKISKNAQGQVTLSLDDTTVILATSDQSIDGIKTFLKSPVIPSPITDTQGANKAYVDQAIRDSAHTTLDGVAGDILLEAPLAIEPESKIIFIDEGAFVTVSGNDTIRGNKTFSGTIAVPNPNQGGQAANKEYVDTAINKSVHTSINGASGALYTDTTLHVDNESKIISVADGVFVGLEGPQTVNGRKSFSEQVTVEQGINNPAGTYYSPGTTTVSFGNIQAPADPQKQEGAKWFDIEFPEGQNYTRFNSQQVFNGNIRSLPVVFGDSTVATTILGQLQVIADLKNLEQQSIISSNAVVTTGNGIFGQDVLINGLAYIQSSLTVSQNLTVGSTVHCDSLTTPAVLFSDQISIASDSGYGGAIISSIREGDATARIAFANVLLQLETPTYGWEPATKDYVDKAIAGSGTHTTIGGQGGAILLADSLSMSGKTLSVAEGKFATIANSETITGEKTFTKPIVVSDSGLIKKSKNEVIRIGQYIENPTAADANAAWLQFGTNNQLQWVVVNNTGRPVATTFQLNTGVISPVFYATSSTTASSFAAGIIVKGSTLFNSGVTIISSATVGGLATFNDNINCAGDIAINMDHSLKLGTINGQANFFIGTSMADNDTLDIQGMQNTSVKFSIPVNVQGGLTAVMNTTKLGNTILANMQADKADFNGPVACQHGVTMSQTLTVAGNITCDGSALFNASVTMSQGLTVSNTAVINKLQIYNADEYSVFTVETGIATWRNNQSGVFQLLPKSATNDPVVVYIGSSGGSDIYKSVSNNIQDDSVLNKAENDDRYAKIKVVSASEYAAISSKEAKTFYLVTDGDVKTLHLGALRVGTLNS